MTTKNDEKLRDFVSNVNGFFYLYLLEYQIYYSTDKRMFITFKILFFYEYLYVVRLIIKVRLCKY